MRDFFISPSGAEGKWGKSHNCGQSEAIPSSFPSREGLGVCFLSRGVRGVFPLERGVGVCTFQIHSFSNSLPHPIAYKPNSLKTYLGRALLPSGRSDGYRNSVPSPRCAKKRPCVPIIIGIPLQSLTQKKFPS